MYDRWIHFRHYSIRLSCCIPANFLTGNWFSKSYPQWVCTPVFGLSIVQWHYQCTFGYPHCYSRWFIGRNNIISSLLLFPKIHTSTKAQMVTPPYQKAGTNSKQINEKGTSGIFLGRLTPFIRGYVAVLCGLLRVTPLKYSSALFLSSISWATCYVCIGYFIGPYQHLFLSSDKNLQILLILVPLFIILLYFLFQFIKKYFSFQNMKIQLVNATLQTK